KQLVSELGLEGLAPDLPADMNGILTLSFSGIGVMGLSQTQWRHPGFENLSYQVQDQVSWTHGRHNVKSGVLLTRAHFAADQAWDRLFGNVQFSNRFTGHPYADFLLGIPTTASRAFAPLRFDQIRWAYDFFAADDFKVRSNLTLNLGLRYELHPGWSEEQGRQAIFDITSGKIVVPDGSLSQVSSLLPRNYVDVVEASKAGFDSSKLLRT